MCVRSFLDDGVNLKIKLNMFEKVFFLAYSLRTIQSLYYFCCSLQSNE